MERELKIVISIFLVFLIYGIGSYFNSGSFITPYFLDKAILIIISVLFFLLNIREKNSLVLFLYIPALFANALTDKFTVFYIIEKWKFDFLLDLYQRDWFILTCILIFFSYFFLATLFLYREIKNKILALLLCLFLVATVVLLGTDNTIMPQILMGMFLLSYFITVQNSNKIKSRIFEVLSAQFLLFVLLSVLGYFI